MNSDFVGEEESLNFAKSYRSYTERSTIAREAASLSGRLLVWLLVELELLDAVGLHFIFGFHGNTDVCEHGRCGTCAARGG